MLVAGVRSADKAEKNWPDSMAGSGQRLPGARPEAWEVREGSTLLGLPHADPWLGVCSSQSHWPPTVPEAVIEFHGQDVV